MKFKSANKNLLSEMDMSTSSSMRRNDKFMEADPNNARTRILKKMGASSEMINRWRAAERKGISFESFLVGVLDELQKGVPVDSDEDDYATAE